MMVVCVRCVVDPSTTWLVIRAVSSTGDDDDDDDDALDGLEIDR